MAINIPRKVLHSISFDYEPGQVFDFETLDRIYSERLPQEELTLFGLPGGAMRLPRKGITLSQDSSPSK